MIETSGEDRRQLRRMRLASVLEATTLAVLVFVAVPLKHVFGMPQFVSAMGPVHGLAFLFYIWMLIQSHFQLKWWRGMAADGGIRLHPARRLRQ
ncbi:DUF3817 domain-containing protein [Rhizobium sp. TH2]|uniref:DUF3817 domain-containing protein n=1 Tax=Rhizobium sp. TH2 TaxID=2775403 RepID=UPI0021584C3D|nr:DUF3817 domain-containing protein [Rhizobium sp. TH2]